MSCFDLKSLIGTMNLSQIQQLRKYVVELEKQRLKKSFEDRVVSALIDQLGVCTDDYKSPEVFLGYNRGIASVYRKHVLYVFDYDQKTGKARNLKQISLERGSAIEWAACRRFWQLAQPSTL